ncbi:MAG: P-II family nitrogen regulator [Polyangiaceae bacterium]|nr:P-II family nitrogen regulator [Polyangiaceae bacterium]
MDFLKLTAIVRSDLLAKVETALQEAGVPGISVTHVVGFGEYTNLYRHDWQCSHAKIEIFIPERAAGDIVTTIESAASTGAAGDGIIAVQPVQDLIRIRTKSRVS